MLKDRFSENNSREHSPLTPYLDDCLIDQKHPSFKNLSFKMSPPVIAYINETPLN